MRKEMQNKFDLTGKTALITGAGGLLGPRHARAIICGGGSVILTDIHKERAEAKSKELEKSFDLKKDSVLFYYMDVTNKESIHNVINDIYDNKKRKVNILVNNAAKDPKIGGNNLTEESRFETMSEETWHIGLDPIVTGAFLTTQAVVNRMKTHEDPVKGVVLNISSDLSVLVSDNRIYRKEGLSEDAQPVKPIFYNVGKTALIAMTRYLAAYYATEIIRFNSLSPTGIWNNQPENFVKKLCDKIPMNRMSNIDEYEAAVLFMCSEASSYMTGQNILISGGKDLW